MLLLAYLTSNIVYCCLLDYNEKPRAALIAELRGRSGHLAVINMLALVLFAARNNPLIPILAVSFDTFNLFHRWIGRVIVLESIVHISAWFVNNHNAIGYDGIMKVLMTDAFVQFGLAAAIAMLVILVQSPSIIRHAFYEIFLHTHQVLAVVALGATAAHIQTENLPQKPIIYTIIGIWALERLLRISRLVYFNVSYRRVTRAQVQALDGGACRVTFDIPRGFDETPGRHIYAYIPSVSLWMSHPFSVAMVENANNVPASSASMPPPQLVVDDLEAASKNPFCTTKAYNVSTSLELTPPTTPPSSAFTMSHATAALRSNRPAHSVSCLMAARTGMTQKLYAKARSSPKGVYACLAMVEGPYGTSKPLDSYGTVTLFAGGVGITHPLSQMHHIVRGWARGTCATQKLILVWSVRSLEQLQWARPWLEELSAMERYGRELEIVVYVTQLRNNVDPFEEINHMQIRPGRANVQRLVDGYFEERIGAMTIGVCGPGALADDVRKAARGVMGKGKVDFWEEAFTW